MDLTFVKEALIITGMPVARSVIGWAQVSFADGKITKFELSKLCETVVRVGSLSVVGYLGLNELGIDVSALAASMGVIAGDMFLSYAKKK